MDRHNKIRSNEIDEIIEQLHEAINDNDLYKLRNVYRSYEFLGPDLTDKKGKTLLQHASYKGNHEVVNWLLQKGADVNCTGNLKSLNTPLHIAAMRGKPLVCSILLVAGANTKLTNILDQTASQVAIEKKNYQCVSVINLYVPGRVNEPYWALGDKSFEQLLPFTLFKPLIEFSSQFFLTTNIHPVRMALEVPPVFLADDNVPKIFKVLNLMSEMQTEPEGNEVVAFRFHYLASVIIEIAKYDVKNNNQLNPKVKFIKKILKSESYLEQLLERCIRTFPFRDCTIFRQMIASLEQGKGTIKALKIIQNMIVNTTWEYSSFDNEYDVCGTCTESNASKICTECKAVRYCNNECQRLHWFIHKKQCKKNSEHEIKDLQEIERVNININDQKVPLPEKIDDIKLKQTNVVTKTVDAEESPDRIKNNINIDISSDLEKIKQTTQDIASDDGDKAFFRFLSCILKDVQKEKKQKIQAEIISNVISGIYKE